MFKVVRDYVEQPQFLIMCDAACAKYIAAPFTAGAEPLEQGQQINFIQSAAQQGWKIALGQQLCPQHVQSQSADQPRILVPSMAMGARRN